MVCPRRPWLHINPLSKLLIAGSLGALELTNHHPLLHCVLQEQVIRLGYTHLAHIDRLPILTHSLPQKCNSNNRSE